VVETETDVYGRDAGGRRQAQTDVLYVAFHGNAPTTRGPSRHLLGTGVAEVSFGRGEPATTRDGETVAFRIDDPLLSTDHGKLVRSAEGTWRLEDPSSKNGAIVGGVRTRSSAVAYGQVFALGHTLFVLARERVDPGRPLDLAGAALPAPLPALASFDTAFSDEISRIARVAPTTISVVLYGETGTGKEVTAAAIHELSRRRGRYVAVNCGGITPTLVESELFGHRKGAFSGATADKPGFVRASDHGTLFLDEIGELPLPAQAALLRVLQEREVVPVGDALPVPVDLRVICATHRDLPALVAEGKFRHDLHARLEGATITLPPLRARRIDLGLLIATLLTRARATDVVVTPHAAIRLFEYAWPTNIRELDKALAYAIAVADGEAITVEHLPETLRAAAPAIAPLLPPRPEPEPLTAEDQRLKQELELQLDECGGIVAEVARRRGVDRTQVYRWLRRFGIARGR
jgi:transcriptional regulator of acetoin/glycerol metabolism